MESMPLLNFLLKEGAILKLSYQKVNVNMFYSYCPESCALLKTLSHSKTSSFIQHTVLAFLALQHELVFNMSQIPQTPEVITNILTINSTGATNATAASEQTSATIQFNSTNNNQSGHSALLGHNCEPIQS